MNRWPATAAATCLLASLPALSGCHGWAIGMGNMDRVREDFRFDRPLQSGGRLEVENANGSVEIVAWEKDSVEITGTKYSDTREHLHQVRIDVNSSPEVLRIRTIGPDTVRGGFT